MSEKNIKARVLVGCRISGIDVRCGSLVTGSKQTLSPHLGVELDDSAAAVKHALSEGEKTVDVEKTTKKVKK